MARVSENVVRLQRRRWHVRRQLAGTPDRPRLNVRRSAKHIYAQIIDDVAGRTLVASSSVALKIYGGNVQGAKAVGQVIAERAKALSIVSVCFDRGGRRYHGRVKALADGAREAGLKF
ncbi:MAG: 50S ribosomal protein L18 [Candidatus Hydrogenedentes bacterium]|nr:50S ribosomal protein L18 [Candidatus Hydrogenedentota bacterium]